MYRSCPWLAVVLLVGKQATANDTNYQNYVVGERALGMGGAFTALADDASGAYYNPAGLALVESTSVSASLNVYGVERRELSKAVGPPLEVNVTRRDLVSSNVPTIPTTVGFLYKFGKRFEDGIKRFGTAYSVLVPQHESFDFFGRTKIDDADDYIVESRWNDKTIWQGPAISMRVTRRLSIGAAGFHTFRSFKWASEVRHMGVRNDDDFTDYMDLQRARLERSVHGLVFKIGARYEITNRWKAGLALTSPSITIWGSGSVHTDSTTHEAECQDPPTCIAYEERGGDVDADSRTPFSARLGVAYRKKESFALALDLSWHAPLTYDPYDLGNNLDKFGETGPVTLTDLRREMVFNANVGGEVLWKYATLRGGLFTNFSSAPEVERSAYASPPRVHMFGATVSAGFRWREYTMSLGVLYCFGRGQSSALTPQDPSATVNQPYGPIDERRDYVYFYIAGAQDALKRTLVKVLRKSRDYIEERLRPDEPTSRPASSSQPASRPAAK